LSSFLPCAFRQNLDKDQNLDKQINSFYIEIKQRIPPIKILPKKSFRKIPKKFQKKFQKIPKKSKQFPKNFQTISQKTSQKIPKILKISNSLHRTWRPKTLSGLFFFHLGSKFRTISRMPFKVKKVDCS
jgi:hypothetical protein